jgi:hypothetical protein
MTAQANARQLVAVAGKTVERLEYQGVPVVTFRMIAEIHGKKPTDVSATYYKNSERFQQGTDCLTANSSEGRALTGKAAPNGLILLTESGYLKLVKTFTDDLAWQIQGQLIDCYFHMKQIHHTPAITDDPILAILEATTAIRRDQISMKNELATNKAQTVQASHLAQTAIDRVDHLEAAITTRTEEFCTIAGFCRIKNIKMTTGEMSGMGKRCRRTSDTKEIPAREMFDPRWGRVGLYHMSVLEECFTLAM